MTNTAKLLRDCNTASDVEANYGVALATITASDLAATHPASRSQFRRLMTCTANSDQVSPITAAIAAALHTLAA